MIGHELIERLRGVYTVPVNDGAGLLNGKDTFTQAFSVTPILLEAANAIEELQTALAESVKLQSHYAELLNMYDGGKRIQFDSGAAWIVRLRECKIMKTT